jgi:hypothetical protein
MSLATSRPVNDAQKRLLGKLATRQEPRSIFKRLFSRGVSIIREPRPRCCVVGVLMLVDKSVPLDGLVTEVEAGGATFRPASSYVLDRTRSEVLLRFATRELRGRIVQSTSKGYDVQFSQELDAGSLAAILGDFGVGDGRLAAAGRA